MQIFLLILIILIFIFIFLELLFLALEKEKFRKIFKVFPLFLISIFLFSYNYKGLYIPAIIAFLYAFGDLLLLSMNKKMFFIGAVSFCLGHVLILFYLFYFKILEYNLISLIVSLIIIVVFSILFFIFMHKKMASFIYGAIFYLSILLFIASYTLTNLIVLNETISIYFIMLMFGFLIYFISDILVIRERFIKIDRFLNLYIMSLYYLANLLIFSFLLLI